MSNTHTDVFVRTNANPDRSSISTRFGCEFTVTCYTTPVVRSTHDVRLVAGCVTIATFQAGLPETAVAPAATGYVRSRKPSLPMWLSGPPSLTAKAVPSSAAWTNAAPDPPNDKATGVSD